MNGYAAASGVTLTATVTGGGGGGSCLTLTTTVNPAASGSVVANPANSSGCPTGQYTLNTVVQLTATAGSGNTFVNWSGDATGSANPVNVTMSTNKFVTANFNVPGGGGGSCPGGETALTSGLALSGQAVATGAWNYYCITVPAGATNLAVTITGGSGDADLYVRFGSQPTLSAYNCRPYLAGNSESCSFTSPAAGTWFIGMNGYAAASGVTLSATASP